MNYCTTLPYFQNTLGFTFLYRVPRKKGNPNIKWHISKSRASFSKNFSDNETKT